MTGMDQHGAPGGEPRDEQVRVGGVRPAADAFVEVRLEALADLMGEKDRSAVVEVETAVDKGRQVSAWNANSAAAQTHLAMEHFRLYRPVQIAGPGKISVKLGCAT
ncbi:hypothetical protein H1V43_21280, partial [Streptomyces sp. PSKA54]